MSKRNLYLYKGPVTSFGKIVKPSWQATTYAPSAAKAKSNLMYRFKTENNRLPTSKIELPGKISLVS